jgi:hypothetical protein
VAINLNELRCPNCGESGAESKLCVPMAADPDEHALYCASCGEYAPITVVRETVAAWTALLAWIEARPKCEE